MANETKYINLSDDTNVSVSTKLYVDKYNNGELAKSVDLKVTELIKPLPDVNLDLVPRAVYNAEVQLNEELQAEINVLNITIDDLSSQLAIKTADSSSLFLENDALKLKEARTDNNLQSIQLTVTDLRTNLTTSLTKAINEATEKTALEAENQGLTAQKNALIKQIDTLNNLLAQANASLAVAQQQLSAKQQAVAAGGLATGELATIVFDGGDPTKKKVEGRDLSNDYNGGFAPENKFAASGDPFKNNFSSYFDVVAGPKDISINVESTEGYAQIPFNFGFTLPITIKANETKRFEMLTANTAWVNGNAGNDGGALFRRSRPSRTDWTMKITIKDIDTNGKTETKDFKMRTYKY